MNKILREEGEEITEDGLITTERLLTSSREQNSSRMRGSSGKKKEIDDFILTKKISTNNLRKEAEKIIVDLNKVIDQLEGKETNKAPKTPNIKSSSRYSYLNTKKNVTSSKKVKIKNIETQKILV